MSESKTILHGSVLLLARIAWGALALFAIGYFAFWAISAIPQPLPDCRAQPEVCNPYYLGAQDVAVMGENAAVFEAIAYSFPVLNALVSLVFVVVSLVIVLRRSNDWMALYISTTLLTLGAVGISPSTTETIPVTSPIYLLITLASFVGYFGPFGALYLFPDGQFVPRWSRWFFYLLVVGGFILFAATNFLIADNSLWIIFGLFIGVCAVVGIGAMVYRYFAVATPIQRQQIKWVALGLLLSAASVLAWVLYSILLPTSAPHPTRTIIVAITFPVIALLNAVFPVSVAIATLRYKLWDIDVLIRRTATYTALSAMLILIFFGTIVLLQRLFASLTGGSQNELVTVLSTLAIAALFVPLRKRLQNAIDRRFNRRKYNSQQVLSDFALTVRDETDLDKLTGRLIEVVHETMQPKTISVWLKESSDVRQEALRGE